MKSADEWLQQAADLFEVKQHADVAAIAREGLAAFPHEGRLWQALGNALWYLDRWRESHHALESASALIPLSPLGQRVLAECYCRAGKPDLAILLFRHLLQKGRCPSELLPGIAASLGRLRKDKLALRACRILARRHPKRHHAHFGTAYYLQRLGATARQVVPSLKRAVRLAPHLLHYRLNLAFVWASTGQIASARKVIAKIDSTSILHPAWLVKMKSIFELAGDAARARSCARQLQRIAQGRCLFD